MAFESRMNVRRMIRTGLLSLVGSLTLCGLVEAQKAVTSGSVIPVQHSAAWGQIMKVQVAKNGSVVLLDWSNSGLYQLPPGSSTFTTIASGSPLEKASTFWNSGMTMDAKDTIYLTDRYGASHFFRIPYNPADGTWDFTSSNAWGATINIGAGLNLNTFDIAFVDSAAKDGSGTLVFSTETSPSIYTVPVDNQGNWGNATTIIKGLKAKAAHITADVNGNIYFLEDNGVSSSLRVTGVFFIPAGKSGIIGSGDGTAEAQVTRIDPVTNLADFSGISLDSAGNIYLSSQADSNGGAFNGTLMVPNTSGSPTGVTAASFNFDQATFLTPVQSSAPAAIDPRGYLWIPTSTSGWTPPGSTAYPGTMNVVLWQPGAANVGTSPVGTAGPVGTIFYNFSQSVTPGAINFSQPGGGSDFVASATNPIADPAATTPQLACTAGKLYAAQTSCPYWVSLNARLPGAVSGELQMLDTSNKLIAQSTTYLYGIGQGADISLAVPTSVARLATGLVSPQQVAADFQGNSYIADSSQGKVLEFVTGAAAGPGVSIGSGLTAPTGVAVDGAGDVYIADSGKVMEIPYLNGSLNAAGQVTLQSGLGSNLKLAVDGMGTVYATDPDNARIVKISNSLTRSIVNDVVTVGTGFTKPSAIAVDSAGDIFVADGSSLIQLNAVFGAQSAITKSLAAPVTGLAVDPSGSVDVAQAGGIIHIPAVAGTLSANSAVALASGAVTTPNGIAIDASGNLYVSDLTGNTPNLNLLSLNASYDFGQVSPFVPSNPLDVNVFNIGNLPLTIMPDPTFAGTNGTDFSVTPALQNACDTTGATPVTPGSSCIIDVLLTAGDVGTRSGTMSVTSNAANAPTVSGLFTGTAVNNLERSVVTLSLNPASGVTFPGTTTATVAVAASVSTSTPTGQVVLTLINQNAKLHQVTTLPIANLVGGTVSFNLSGILGGIYTVQAVYHGDSNFSGGLVKTTLTVAQAAPAIKLTEPSNVAPILGTYYVLLGSNTTLQASISSALGSPTGSIVFMNGSTVADPKQASTTLDANGNAVFTTQNLGAGVYTLTAVYGSDQNFSTITSPVITFQVLPPSVLITSNPASITTKAGTPVQATLTLQSIVGYEAPPKTGGVFIACDNTTVPKYSECTFDVPQPTIVAGTPGITTVTLSTNLPVNVGAVRKGSSPISFASIFGLGLLGLAVSRRTKVYRAALNVMSVGLLLAAVATGLSGCTNSSYSTPPPSPHVTTPSGTYNIRLYATDPSDGTTKTLPFTLPVTIQ